MMGIEVDPAQAEAMLAELSAHRVRARERRRGDMWIAALVAAVALVGAVAFAVETPMTVVSCTSAAVCEMDGSIYDGWALWVAAGAVGIVGLLVARHLRGVRRARARRWAQRLAALFVGADVAALFAGYGVGTLGADMPFMFPAAAASIVGIVAARRRDWLVVAVCAVAAAAIVAVGMRTRMAGGEWWFEDQFRWWFTDNLGYIASSLLSALIAAAAAVKWRRTDVA